MLPLTRCRQSLLALLVLVLLATFGIARVASAQGDPPGRVARLNYTSGQVSFRPASLEDWGVATINYPLTTGDHLWTDVDSSAELHVGSAVMRLAPETAFAFLNLDDYVVQARVAEGTIDVRVREIFQGEVYEVDTPNAAVSILAPGVYRIDVDPEGDRTRVTVRSGEAEVDADGRTFSVYPGQMGEILGVENAAYDLGRAPSPDRWELWCRDRDRREDNRAAVNYVSRDTIGYEDLDDYGTWSYEPEYGYAWTPTVVAVDWAPYRYGRWTWVRPWGWTWIDQARWGFAPFHYGRWAFCRTRWVWVPGRRAVRPVWAPALVAFVGGNNWRFSFAWGSRPAVGWFPLAPGEIYCPLYPASPIYRRNINVTHVNVTNINVANINVSTLHYANRAVGGAMTAVPREVFVGAQAVNRGGTAVPRAAAEQTAVVGHAVAVSPDRTSVIGRLPAAAARPPASVMKRAVLARSEPPSEVTRDAPVVSLSRRPAPGNARPTATFEQGVPGGANAAGSARARRADDNPPVESPARADANASGDSRPARSSGIANDRPTDGTTIYRIPRTEPSRGTWSDTSRPATPAGRPRESEPASGGWKPADRGTQPDVSRPSSERQRVIESSPVQVPDRAVPRDERPAPGYERATSRDDRPAPSSPSRENSSARPRGDDRPSAPQRVERSESPRPESPKAESRGSSGGPSTPSARPAERGSDRPQPSSSSGGRGGQSQGSGSSQGSARPRGGRGGDK